MDDMQVEHFVCGCSSPEHTLRFTFATYGGDPEIYTEVFLNFADPWYKRVWKAVKYIFGYRCQYGHFDCFTMKPEDATRLRMLCEEFEKHNAMRP